jgi:hypothetical protein
MFHEIVDPIPRRIGFTIERTTTATTARRPYEQRGDVYGRRAAVENGTGGLIKAIRS